MLGDLSPASMLNLPEENSGGSGKRDKTKWHKWLRKFLLAQSRIFTIMNLFL
jgi:hypothetical protein